jgi:hypothetical protein
MVERSARKNAKSPPIPGRSTRTDAPPRRWGRVNLSEQSRPESMTARSPREGGPHAPEVELPRAERPSPHREIASTLEVDASFRPGRASSRREDAIFGAERPTIAREHAVKRSGRICPGRSALPTRSGDRLLCSLDGRGGPARMPRLGTRTKTERDRAVLRGLPKLFDRQTFAEIGRTRYTQQTVRALLQRHLRAMAKVRSLTIARRMAVEEERALERRVHVVVMGLKSIAGIKAGKFSAAIRELGFEPAKQAVMTPAVKAAANVKRQATRKLRGIGKKR